MTMVASEKIAKILRIDRRIIKEIEDRAGSATGKRNVLDKIIEENESLIKQRLQLKELGGTIFAEEIYQALIEKIRIDDLQLFKALGKPSFMLKEDVDAVLAKVKELIPPAKGFFLKKEKAVEFLKNEPPAKIIKYLGYGGVDELIAREDVYEVFSAIRVFEDAKWFNETFAKQYLALTPNDFEEREVQIVSLGQKWVGVAQSFLKKKYQNISHLKEFGVIFVIPLELGMLGEVTRMFSLALHYFYEVQSYAEFFKIFATNPQTFGANLASAIRVDIISERPPKTGKQQWLIIPRYLTRYDENDWRLFEPHISPEALYWGKAERALVNINTIFKDVHVDFTFWQGLDWVGDYFKTRAGIEVLVSFNLVDAIMTLIREKELEKYLYHHQESLWNKMFIEYFGEEQLEKVIKENFVRGYAEI